MAASGICCGLYRGTFFLKDLSVPNSPLLSVGNAEANITQELTTIEQPNFQQLGGTNCKVEYVESVAIDLTLYCTSPENLALAFMGEASQLTSGTATDEEHPVNSIGELIPFDKVPLAITSVTGPAGTPAYTEGDDYIVTPAGIQIIEGSDIPVIGGNIEVTYTYGDNWVVDAQTVAAKEFLVVLEGTNYGEGDGKPFVLKAWKVKFAPAENFALISGTDFANLELSGEILIDNTKLSGSKFMKLEWGMPA